MDGIDIKLLWGTYAMMWRGPRESSTASAQMRHLRYFHFSTPTSRASSSQNFEPALRPPSSRFSRRSRADPAAHFSSISCGKCSSPCCGNFRKISAEILREILKKYQQENFAKVSENYFCEKFPLEILRIFKVKNAKNFLRALRARY